VILAQVPQLPGCYERMKKAIPEIRIWPVSWSGWGDLNSRPLVLNRANVRITGLMINLCTGRSAVNGQADRICLHMRAASRSRFAPGIGHHLLIRRYPCGHPDSFRSVRDLGRCCPLFTRVGELEGRSSVWLPVWLPAAEDTGHRGALVLVTGVGPSTGEGTAPCPPRSLPDPDCCRT
jgi:hypothetical protein